MMFTEGKKVKKVEGVPTPVAQRLEDSEAIVFEEEKKEKDKDHKKSIAKDAILEQEV
jgi:hypothetical protein